MLLGARIVESAVGSGRFHCPECDDDRPYALVVVRRLRRLLGLPMGSAEMGRHVRCDGCGSTFPPAVLYSDDERFARRVEAALREGLRGIVVRMVIEDGRIEPEERAVLNAVHEELLGRSLDTEAIEKEVEAAEADPKPAADFARTIARFLEPADKETVLRAALRVAAADGELHPSERRLIAEIGAGLDMTPEAIRRVIDHEGTKR